MRGCVGTFTSCSTAITKHTVCNTGSINIFGQQLTLCYTTMHVEQDKNLANCVSLGELSNNGNVYVI